MRRARLKAPKSHAVSYTHCVSRIVNRDFVLKETEKTRFYDLMRMYEEFCGLRIVSYCLMSNHFHLLVEVPRRPGAEGGLAPQYFGIIEETTHAHSLLKNQAYV
jgi:hypothetical protein